MAVNDSLSQLPLPELFKLGHQAIENALAAPEILAALDPAYHAASLNEKLAELVALEEADRQQGARYGAQYGATDATNAAWDTFQRDVYMHHVGLARIVFRDDRGALARLGLLGDREDAFGAWAKQVNQFYGTLAAEPSLAGALGKKGVTAADLTAARAQFEALRETERGQEDDKGEAQQATRSRDALVAAFEDWLGEYRDTARHLLREHPDWLERLGFLARSGDEG